MDTESFLSAACGLLAVPSTADRPDLRRALGVVLGFVGPGFTVERFESGGKPSALVYRGPQRSRFRVILNAHLDVVPAPPDQFRPRRVVVRLYARGAQDMKVPALVQAQVFRWRALAVPDRVAACHRRGGRRARRHAASARAASTGPATGASTPSVASPRSLSASAVTASTAPANTSIPPRSPRTTRRSRSFCAAAARATVSRPWRRIRHDRRAQARRPPPGGCVARPVRAGNSTSAAGCPGSGHSAQAGLERAGSSSASDDAATPGEAPPMFRPPLVPNQQAGMPYRRSHAHGWSRHGHGDRG